MFDFYGVMNFDAVKFLKETVSRVGYVCEIQHVKPSFSHTSLNQSPYGMDHTPGSGRFGVENIQMYFL